MSPGCRFSEQENENTHMVHFSKVKEAIHVTYQLAFYQLVQTSYKAIQAYANRSQGLLSVCFCETGRWSLCVCEYVLFACGCLWWRNRPSDSLARLPMDLDKEVHYHKGLPGSGVVFPQQPVGGFSQKRTGALRRKDNDDSDGWAKGSPGKMKVL